MVGSVLSTFACINIDAAGVVDDQGLPLAPGPAQGSYWLSDMHQRCWQAGGTQMPVALSIGLLGTLLLLLVMPGAIFWVVIRHRNSLDSPSFLVNFGSLVSDYKPRVAWWEAVNLLLMALLVAVNTFGKAIGAYLNLLCFAGAQLLTVLLQALGRPQRAHRLHWLQTIAYCGVLLVRRLDSVFVCQAMCVGGGLLAMPLPTSRSRHSWETPALEVTRQILSTCSRIP